MRRRVSCVLARALLLVHLALLAKSSSSSHHTSTKNCAGKTEYVHGYYKKNGSYLGQEPRP